MDTTTPRRRRLLGALHRYVDVRIAYAMATQAERAAWLPGLAEAWHEVEAEADALACVRRRYAARCSPSPATTWRVTKCDFCSVISDSGFNSGSS